MRYLSLFTGAGGFDLACQHLLVWQCMGYVEWDKYCCNVLEQRIKDGLLHDAPIFQGDIRQWIADGYAASYTGLVDAVVGGFPCQPFSGAGKRKGADDERNMWPATIAAVRQVRPRHCFVENVPGLLSSGYFGTIVNDLAESGYSVRWRRLSAGEVGAPHKRDRVWIMAHPHNDYKDRRPIANEVGGQWRTEKVANDGYAGGIEWPPESGFCRVAHGVADRVDRLKAIGNGIVPQVAATAWRLLTQPPGEVTP